MRSDTGPFALIPEWVLDLPISDRAVRLYLTLGLYADKDGASFPSRKTLADRMGCSSDTVDRAKSELIQAGALSVEKRQRENGSNTSNVYVLARVRPPSRTDAATPLVTGAATRTRPSSNQTVEAKASTAAEVSTQNGFHVETATGGALIKHFIDEATAVGVPMPRKVVGHLARSVGELLSEGHSPEQVWAGLGRMVERRVVQPSLLPNFVTEAAIPKQQPRRYGYGVQSSEIHAGDPDVFGPGNPYLEET